MVKVKGKVAPVTSQKDTFGKVEKAKTDAVTSTIRSVPNGCMRKSKIKLRNLLRHCLLTEDITYVGSIRVFTPISQYWSCYKAPLIASRAKSLATASRKPYSFII